MKPFVITLAVLVAIARPAFLFVDFNQHVDAGYQAFAHILVGGLLGAWIVNRHRWLMVTLVLLTIVEVACAGLKISGVHPPVSVQEGNP